MKKLAAWLLALVICLVSLVAMCLFDDLLAWVYHFIGKVELLTEILASIGEVLDLGLTALVAVLIVHTVWGFGYDRIKILNPAVTRYEKSPIYHINNVIGLLFLVMLVVLGYDFVKLVGEMVRTYTEGFRGLGKCLLFFKALKDTYLLVGEANFALFRIGTNALFLFVGNLFAPGTLDAK